MNYTHTLHLFAIKIHFQLTILPFTSRIGGYVRLQAVCLCQLFQSSVSVFISSWTNDLNISTQTRSDPVPWRRHGAGVHTTIGVTDPDCRLSVLWCRVSRDIGARGANTAAAGERGHSQAVLMSPGCRSVSLYRCIVSPVLAACRCPLLLLM